MIDDDYVTAFHNVAALPDGSFMLCGDLQTNITITNNVYRFTKNGIPDSSFNTNGILNIYSGPRSSYPAISALLTIQPDNKFLLSFIKNFNTARNETITRYLPGGKVDSSFATNGVIKVSTMGYNTFITKSLLLQKQDYKIVTLGNSSDYITDSGFFLYIPL